jgi:hypothetical protein
VLTKIKKEKALEKLEEYSKIVDKLIKIGHKQGEELRESLNLKIRALVRNAFDDGQQKVQDFDAYVNSYIISAGVQKSDREEQEDYERRLRDTRTYISSCQEEILILDTDSEHTKTTPFVDTKKVFIIHGHDEINLLRLEKLLRREFNLIPVIQKEEPQSGRTLIEKFEAIAQDISYAFALITADDIIMDGNNKYSQARPNVIFELGWFYGKRGRQRVSLIFKKGTKIHSDLDGIGRIEFNKNVEEKVTDIRNELRAAGILNVNST